MLESYKQTVGCGEVVRSRQLAYMYSCRCLDKRGRLVLGVHPAHPVRLTRVRVRLCVCVCPALFLRAFLSLPVFKKSFQGDCLPHRSDSPTKRLLWWYWYQWGRSLMYLWWNCCFDLPFVSQFIFFGYHGKVAKPETTQIINGNRPSWELSHYSKEFSTRIDDKRSFKCVCVCVTMANLDPPRCELGYPWNLCPS